MDMLSSAIYATSFLKQLQESTSGKEPAIPVGEPGRSHRAERPGVMARIASVAATVRCRLRSLRWRLAA